MTLRIDPVSLKLFVAVCEQGSIAAAAETEFIAASAISKRIAEMEHWVGTPLLSRGQRGVRPTAAGRAMLRHSRLILNHIRQLQADLVLHGQGVRGQVHVLANISSMAEFLPDCIRTFAARYPQVAITLEERRSAEVVKGIEDGEADIGISRAFVPSQGLTCFPLRSDRFGVVVDAAHPLASAETIPFAMTLGYERIGLAAGQGQLPSLQAVMAREATEHGRDLVYRVRVSSYDVALRLLQGTPALSVMPMEVALPRVKALGLVVIPLKDAWATQHFTAFVRPDEQRAPAVDQLLRHLLDTLGTSAPAPQDS